MNTERLILLASLSLVWASLALGARSEFCYETAVPSKKTPIAVNIPRNPFRGASEAEKPLPVLQDKEDPASKLPGLLNGHIRSVFRQPRGLLLVDSAVFQPGDEIKLGREPLLPKYRVVLKSIESDRLVFHVMSLDPQMPGQVEAVVLLGASMRRN